MPSSPISSSLAKQEVRKQEEPKPLKIDLKRALNSAPFEGIPLERSSPRNQQELAHKLSTTKFATIEQILNFYEANRELFSEAENFEKVLAPLAGLCKHKRAELKD